VYIDRKGYILEVPGRTVRHILNARTLRDAQVKADAQMSKDWMYVIFENDQNPS